MVLPPFTDVGTVSSILALSKTAWKLGTLLSKLDQNASIADNSVKNLASDVKSLGNECDLLYAELEAVLSKGGTRSASPCGIDSRMWNCLATQVGEADQTMQELDRIIRNVQCEEPGFVGQARHRRKLDQNMDQMARIRIKVRMHKDNLHTIQLLINTILTYIAPCQADWRLAKELDKLQTMVETLQRSLASNPQSQPSHDEATLMQCAHDVIKKGTTMYEASMTAASVVGGQRGGYGNVRVGEWINTLETIRQDQRRSGLSNEVHSDPSVSSTSEVHTMATSATSVQHSVHDHENLDAAGSVSDDDLDVDLAQAALKSGIAAFAAQNWEEADALLQESLRVLQQLPKRQREFCDILGLQYKLAVCAYHTQAPSDAEEALMSLVQQSATCDEHRGYIYNASHLLSLLYIRTGQLGRARAECENALHARRKLLGKQSDAALESTALMAHIYALLNHHARAFSFIAMIPEERRDAILKTVEASLGSQIERSGTLSPRSPSIAEGTELAAERFQSRLSTSSLATSTDRHGSRFIAASLPQSPTASDDPSQHSNPYKRAEMTYPHSVTVRSSSSVEVSTRSRTASIERANGNCSTDPEAVGNTNPGPVGSRPSNQTFTGTTLDRKTILENIGCQPRDDVADAVCNSDDATLARLLERKKKAWRTKLLKRGPSERVGALHFAALFGEIGMARRLLEANFDVNEVPHGYSTNITPLKFAIGARQVKMVEFLIAHGAYPSQPDSWSTLAGQLMNHSWLKKTMSEAEKEFVPNQIVAILDILLKHGWNINKPYDESGVTVLQQAVTFWTGSFQWDLSLRTVVTSFLCGQGADPYQADTKGRTPHNMASASGLADILLILERGSRGRGFNNKQTALFELPAEPRTPQRRFDSQGR